MKRLPSSSDLKSIWLFRDENTEIVTQWLNISMSVTMFLACWIAWMNPDFMPKNH